MRLRHVVAAVALGVVAALGVRATAQNPAPLPPDAIARVGDQPVPREDYARALALLQAERRVPIAPAERRLALERLVEEELLLQAALRVDRIRTDPAAAAAVVDAVLAPVLIDAEAGVPADPPETLSARRAAAREQAFARFLASLRAAATIEHVSR